VEALVNAPVKSVRPSFLLSTLTSDEEGTDNEPYVAPAFPVQNKDGIYEIENPDQHK
jgi:hypothetical protein